MDFILYFVLRRLFCTVSFSANELYLRKGLFLRRESIVPASVISVAQFKQTLLMRLLRAKRVTLRTLSGTVTFYLRKDEHIPFLPRKKKAALRPKMREVVLGAFSETRALSAALTFSFALSRLGRLTGSRYSDYIMNTINLAADELAKALWVFNVALPRATVVIAVFLPLAWLFAFVRKLLGMSGYSLFADKKHITVTRGLFTLYEQTLMISNINDAISSFSVVTALVGAAPLYSRGMMILPALNEKNAARVRKSLLHFPCAETVVLRPPKEAALGHCIAPLGWGAAFCTAEILMRFLPPFFGKSLLQSLLWCGTAVCGWLAAAYLIYMRRSVVYIGKSAMHICARKGARLVSADVPLSGISSYRRDVSVFQQKSRRCDFQVCIRGYGALKLRHAKRI